jgi:hypothetical protein
MKFTYSAYENLINQLILNGYKICSYHDYYKNREKISIIRHDVDNSLEKALEMAKLEKRMGICSTYFILLSTDFYNLASKHSLEFIHEIRHLGHEIGLHFDEIKYAPCDTRSVIGYIEKELYMMSILLGWDIKSISMHRPSEDTLKADYKLGNGIVNSYSKEFFKNFKYVSDSRRCWREDIEGIVASGEYKKLHILIHPFWYNCDEKTLEESVKNYVNSANVSRYESMKENIRNLDEIMKNTDVLTESL